MDEKIKHRIIGLIVLLIVFFLLAPILFKRVPHRYTKNEKKQHYFHNLKHKQIIHSKLAPAKTNQPAMKMVALDEADKSLSNDTQQVVTYDSKIPLARMKPKKIKIYQVGEISKPAQQQKLVAVAKTKLSSRSSKSNQLPKEVVDKTSVHYRVQLATFSSKDNAKRLVSKLAQLGVSAPIDIKAFGKEKHLNKVLVGKKLNRQQALALKEQLQLQTHLNGFVVRG